MDCSWNFSGRTCVVTGAANGIGREVCLLLAGADANVVLVDRDEENLATTHDDCIEISGENHLAICADVSQQKEVNRMVSETIGQFEKIDFLVAGAGILYRTTFREIEMDEWDEVMNTNVRGLFMTNQKVVEHMVEQGEGRIVNIASVAGRSMSMIGGAHYATSKHAVVGISRHMARELCNQGIRVNAFCPGATHTNMIHDNLNTKEVEALNDKIGLNRLADAEEQARVIAFMLSDAASYMNGACLDSNGGSVML